MSTNQQENNVEVAEARNRMIELVSEVMAKPGNAAELAAEMRDLGNFLGKHPGGDGPFGPPILAGMCVAHDQVCKKHQICNGHKKTAS